MVTTGTEGTIDALVKRIQYVQGAGPRKVLVVSASWTHRDLRKTFDAAGIRDVMVLDLLSTMLGIMPDTRPGDAVFVPSPTMLEMTAMRVEQMHRMMGGDVHVIVDSLDSLVRYSPRKSVEEFTHYLVNRLRSLDASGDLFVNDVEDGRKLLEAARPYTDGTLPIEAKQ